MKRSGINIDFLSFWSSWDWIMLQWYNIAVGAWNRVSPIESARVAGWPHLIHHSVYVERSPGQTEISCGSFHIHATVYQMWPACYSCWFNRRTLFHAPAAMLYHWSMIQSHDDQNDRKSILMPLLFTSYDNYLWSSKYFEEGLTWSEDLTICQKPTKYGQVMFCEAVMVDMTNSKYSSFNDTKNKHSISHHCVIWRFIWSHQHTQRILS